MTCFDNLLKFVKILFMNGRNWFWRVYHQNEFNAVMRGINVFGEICLVTVKHFIFCLWFKLFRHPFMAYTLKQTQGIKKQTSKWFYKDLKKLSIK